MVKLAGKYKVYLGLSLLLLLVWYVDFSSFSQHLERLAVPWLMVALLGVIGSTLIGSFNLHLLVNKNRIISYGRFLPSYWLAWSVSLITPGQIGDIASLPVFLKRQGLTHAQTLGCLLIDKLLSFIVISVLAIAGILLWFGAFLVLNQSLFMGVLFFIVGIGGIVVWKKSSIKSYLDSHHLNWVKGIGEMLDEMVDTVRREPYRVLVNFIVTWFKVSLIGLSYWAMFAAFGYVGVSFVQVLPLMAASSLVAYLPISFNGLGTAEITGVILFSVLDIPEVVILSSYILLRVLVLVVAWVPVLTWLLCGGRLSNK